MSTRVGKIVEVTYEIKTNPARLVVRAKGEVSSTGWTNAVLYRRVYSSPPADGVWEYDLFADRPSGSGAAMSSVEATNIWDDYDTQQVSGIRVYGEGEGIVEQIFGQPAPPSSGLPIEI